MRTVLKFCWQQAPTPIDFQETIAKQASRAHGEIPKENKPCNHVILSSVVPTWGYNSPYLFETFSDIRQFC